MNKLVDLLIDKIGEVCVDLVFTNKSSGQPRGVRVVHSFTPKDNSWSEGEALPIVRVCQHKGSYLSSRQELSVVVVGAIWTMGDVAAGTRDIKKLADAIGGLTRSRQVGVYKLTTPIDYFFGLETERSREGIQPHPVHIVTFYLNFTT